MSDGPENTPLDQNWLKKTIWPLVLGFGPSKGVKLAISVFDQNHVQVPWKPKIAILGYLESGLPNRAEGWNFISEQSTSWALENVFNLFWATLEPRVTAPSKSRFSRFSGFQALGRGFGRKQKSPVGPLCWALGQKQVVKSSFWANFGLDCKILGPLSTFLLIFTLGSNKCS